MIRDTLIREINAAIERGVTMYRIAADAGVSHAAFARFVSGECPDIRISTADKLAAYFDLELAPRKPATARKPDKPDKPPRKKP